MKTKLNFRHFPFAVAFTGLILLSASSFAQQKTEEQASTNKKTFTIHITKEVDGNTVVIDTTVVTDGDFDADAFLEEKGVLDDMPANSKHIEKDVIICHPGGGHEFSRNNSDDNLPDTVFINNDTIIVFSDKFDMSTPPPHPGMSYNYNFGMPADFPLIQGPQIEEMFEGLANSFGLENVMPFGEMKKMVVKKKRNGKKVIITFEERDKETVEQEHGNKKNQEKVIIYKNGGQSSVPQNEERIIIDGQTGEKIIINKKVETNGDEKTITVKADVDKSAPVVKEKKVIIIKEQKTK
jgi:hypothetical protein